MLSIRKVIVPIDNIKSIKVNRILPVGAKSQQRFNFNDLNNPNVVYINRYKKDKVIKPLDFNNDNILDRFYEFYDNYRDYYYNEEEALDDIRHHIKVNEFDKYNPDIDIREFMLYKK